MTLNYIGFGLIIISFAGILSGIVGLFRFPDFFTKQHASGVIESAMIPMAIMGLALIQNNIVISLKLIFIIILILLLNPLTTHMLAKAKMGLNNK